LSRNGLSESMSSNVHTFPENVHILGVGNVGRLFAHAIANGKKA
jgi:hypothetical protein